MIGRRKRPKDPQTDAAAAVLMDRFFGVGTKRVYYGRQLEVALEREFFHWITKRALNELAARSRIRMDVRKVGGQEVHFYRPPTHRYPRREMREIAALVAEISDPGFGSAIGAHGELSFDAAMARTEFRVRAENVSEWGGRRWTKSGHNLDRVIERDGVAWGVEIKNTLGYIDQTEFETKLEMCRELRLRPLFVVRMAPRNYIEATRRANGFTLVTGEQHYPVGREDQARRVRERLGFPVRCVKALPDGTLRRFSEWEERKRK